MASEHEGLKNSETSCEKQEGSRPSRQVAVFEVYLSPLKYMEPLMTHIESPALQGEMKPVYSNRQHTFGGRGLEPKLFSNSSTFWGMYTVYTDYKPMENCSDDSSDLGFAK